MCEGLYVIDIAWLSVPYGLYSAEPEGHSLKGEGHIETPLPCYMYYISQGWGACTLLGNNR